MSPLDQSPESESHQVNPDRVQEDRNSSPCLGSTAEIGQKIVSSIRSGAYPHVAAQAWGVPPEVFDEWMQRGTGPQPCDPYSSFAKDVLQAQAQARLRAEMAAFNVNPRDWLHHGPGRES